MFMSKAHHLAEAILLLTSICAVARAQTSAPSSAPTSAPTTAASIPPDVQPLLDGVRLAYTSSNSLQLDGTVSFRFEAGGEKRNESAAFTSIFRAPNQFRHETKDDVLIVCTGKNGYAFLPAKNQYFEFDAP